MPELLVGETDGDCGVIAATTAACEVHVYHDPRPTYRELHHVVPRAWQAFWRPATPPFPGTYDGEHLWDDRTIAVCRTGHGNIHFWLTAMTHSWQEGDDVSDLARRVRSSRGGRLGARDFLLAVEGLQRFVDAGGSIEDLVSARLWGQI